MPWSICMAQVRVLRHGTTEAELFAQHQHAHAFSVCALLNIGLTLSFPPEDSLQQCWRTPQLQRQGHGNKGDVCPSQQGTNNAEAGLLRVPSAVISCTRCPPPHRCTAPRAIHVHLRSALVRHQARAASRRICSEGTTTPSGGMLAPQGMPLRGAVQVTAAPT